MIAVHRRRNPAADHAAEAVVIYDLQGRRVRSLVDGVFERGIHEARWNGVTDAGKRAGSGVYLARLRTAAGTSGTKLMLVK